MMHDMNLVWPVEALSIALTCQRLLPIDNRILTIGSQRAGQTSWGVRAPKGSLWMGTWSMRPQPPCPMLACPTPPPRVSWKDRASDAKSGTRLNTPLTGCLPFCLTSHSPVNVSWVLVSGSASGEIQTNPSQADVVILALLTQGLEVPVTFCLQQVQERRGGV